MLKTLQNKEIKGFIKRKKKPYKHLNKCLVICICGLVLLAAIALLTYLQLRYTYNQLDTAYLSARTTYKDGVVIIDDDTFTGKETVLSNTDIDRAPTLTLEGNKVKMDTNGIKDVHLAWILTGSQKFVYEGNHQWKKLLEAGSKFSYNSGNGYRTAYNTAEIELTEDGWYTVFALWYVDNHKLYVVTNFYIGDPELSGGSGEYEQAAYRTWETNKKSIVSTKGVQNILFIGADQWDKSESVDSDSDCIVLVTINSNRQELTYTMISKESYVYIPTIGCGRLTSAYNYGGVELLVRTVEENYGVNIDNFLLLDYNCYIRMINIVGGVDVPIKDYQAKYINKYIDDLKKDYRLYSEMVDADYVEARTGTVHLDGAQALAYVRYYDEGDWARSERYDFLLDSFRSGLKSTKLSTIVKKIFPLFTTDLTFNDYCDLLYHLPLYQQFSMQYYTLPCENRIAPFKESYRHTVLLNKDEEIRNVTAALMTNQCIENKITIWISPIVVAVYFVLVGIVILLTIYTIIRKRKIVYIGTNGQKRIKKTKYRWNQEVHVYHQDVLGEFDGEMFMDRQFNYRYHSTVKMPMHNLAVYLPEAVDADSDK